MREGHARQQDRAPRAKPLRDVVDPQIRALAPKRARTVRLRPNQTWAEAFHAILAEVADHISHNWAVVLQSDDPEGVHQLRIGLRRLRTLERLFRSECGHERFRDLHRQVRELNGITGQLRDIDILIDNIVEAPRADGSQPGFGKLRERLLSERDRRRRDARNALASPDWSKFRRTLQDARRTAGLRQKKSSERLGEQADVALAKRWRKVRKSGSDLDALSVEERHKLRKRLKTLRYAFEFFAPLYGSKAARKFLERLRSMQQSLGYLNDVATAERLGTAGARKDDDPEVERAIGYVLGWHSAQAEHACERAQKRWRGLRESARPWRRSSQ